MKRQAKIANLLQGRSHDRQLQKLAAIVYTLKAFSSLIPKELQCLLANMLRIIIESSNQS